jgi:putative transposase
MVIKKHNAGYKALRKGRYSVAQQIYFIAFITHNRNPLFKEWDLACLASKMLSNNSAWNSANILSWVLMPDHFHGLIELKEHQNLSAVVKLAKGRSAHFINHHRQTKGKIWMDGFYDHAIRKQEDLQSVARYIVLNPVRSGLVKRCEDYSFWDAAWLE